MLTEQQLTEDIEIDDEPVEQNTAHSVFFDTYYKSITDIESSNRQLLDAQEQFRWYTSQLDEVDRLADEVSISNSSTIEVTDLPRIIKLDRFSDEKDFQLFFRNVNQLKETKFQQGEEIHNTEKLSRTRLSTLDSQLTSITGEIKSLETVIANEESRIKKNMQMFFAGTAIFITIVLALSFPAIGGWFLLPGLCAAFIFGLVYMDLL
jgi:lipopolysaccharide biosynthesis protein